MSDAAARALAISEAARRGGIETPRTEGWCQDVPCSYCRAERNLPCRSYTGNTAAPHKVRVEASLRKRKEAAEA